MVRGISPGKGFWVVNTWRAPTWKWLKRSTLNFAQTFLTGCWTKTWPRFFWQWAIHFYCHNSMSFESIFCIKTNESKLFKKDLKIRKSRAWFCLLATYKCKWIIEICNSVGARAHKVGKIIIYGSNLTLIFSIFRVCEKR